MLQYVKRNFLFIGASCAVWRRWRQNGREYAANGPREGGAGRKRNILIASLDARHIGLRHPEKLGNLSLAKPGPLARLAQTPSKLHS